jgi:hypothetical protein
MRTATTDVHMEKICGALGKSLKKIDLSLCELLTDKSLLHLSKLELLDLNVCGVPQLTMQGTYNFLQATRSTLKRFHCNGMIYHVFRTFLNPPSRVLRWCVVEKHSGGFVQRSMIFEDSDVSFLIQILGSDRFNEVEEVDLSQACITEASVALISRRMKNIKKLKLNYCLKIKFENLTLENSVSGNLDDDDHDDNNSTTLHTLHHLSEFYISGTRVNDQGLDKIMSAFGAELRILDLDGSYRLTSFSSDVIAEKCVNLEKIFARNLLDSPWLHVESFKRKMPNCELVDR